MDSAYIERRQAHFESDHEKNVRHIPTCTAGDEVFIKRPPSTAATLAEQVADVPHSKLRPRSLGPVPCEGRHRYHRGRGIPPWPAKMSPSTAWSNFPTDEATSRESRRYRLLPSATTTTSSISTRITTRRRTVSNGAMADPRRGYHSPTSRLAPSSHITNALACCCRRHNSGSDTTPPVLRRVGKIGQPSPRVHFWCDLTTELAADPAVLATYGFALLGSSG